MIEITKALENDIAVLNVIGDIDASSSIELDSAISNSLEEGHKKILVDCKNLNYISSAGLGVFMSYIEEFETRKINLVLCNMNDKVLSVFEILGLDQLLKLTGNKDQAKKFLNEL
jgi:anti-sigma B factor antagonist